MKLQKGIVPKKLLHAAIVFCVAVLGLASVGITTANYISERHAGDTATVACFSPSLSSDHYIDVSGIQKPGDFAAGTFTVQNFTGETVTNVAMKYQIILKTTGNLPLQITLWDGEDTPLGVLTCDGTGGEQKYVYQNSAFVFGSEGKETHDYRFRVEWQSDQKDAKFSGLTDAVYLSAQWEQID